MADYVPELGQALFSGGGWYEIEMSRHVELAISTISGELYDRGLARSDPSSNTGATYQTNVFVIRAHCWCDGDREGHYDECPPNFEWRDFRARWYKYLGRGSTQSREMSQIEALKMAQECIDSLPIVNFSQEGQ